jgi:uncharacterized protein YacL
MVYFYYATGKSEIVQKYKSSLSSDLEKLYEKIAQERMSISYQGFGLGLLLSLLIIFYNLKIKGTKMSTLSLVCLVVATCFLTNYFYYTLYPKSDWILNHVDSPEQAQAWLKMYKEMSRNYHMGLVLGIVGVGVLAFAFRC